VRFPFIVVDYFLEDRYIPEINRDNPLGWKGRVADEYGGMFASRSKCCLMKVVSCLLSPVAMLKELWSGKYRVVAPAKFKTVLGEFAPRFSGFQQQDSSELLSFLLDGLHEDLNRIRKKPATQTVESKGRPDKEVCGFIHCSFRVLAHLPLC